MKPTLSGAPCANAGSGNAPARPAAAAPLKRSRRLTDLRILLMMSLPGYLPRCAQAIAAVVASRPRQGKLADWRTVQRKPGARPRGFLEFRPSRALDGASVLSLPGLAHMALRIKLHAEFVDEV